MTWWKKSEEDEIEAVGTSEVKKETASSEYSSDKSYDESAKEFDKRYGGVRSALGSGTVIQGKLSFDTPVRIDGNLTGEVFSSSVLIVGKTGKISADINVETLVVLGSVSGTIKARKRLEVHDGGELIGDMESPSLYIQQGAFFEGTSTMVVEEEKKEEVTKSEASTGDTPKDVVPIVRRAKKKSDDSSDEKSDSKIADKKSSDTTSVPAGENSPRVH